ncbi:MAG: hypothetical protein Q4A61_04480 [Porphyromonadaceae bacterium]|nr:hypothetical protein [Porphyromonadaceae bacterium]
MSTTNAPKRPQRVQLLLSVGLAVLGALLLIAGFFAPPIGGIAPSVLVAYGEVMTFSAALMGIDYHYRR